MDEVKLMRLMVLIDDTAVRFGGTVAIVAYGLTRLSGEYDDALRGLVHLARVNQSNLPFMRALANADEGHEIAAAEIARFELSVWEETSTIGNRWSDYTGDVKI